MTEVIERLNYYQLQFLGAEDFKAEQIYHRDMRRRHNLGPHTWGIVEGLELVEQPRGDGGIDVYVQPGLAIDGFGREIVVGAQYKLDASDFRFIKPVSSTSSRTISVHIAYGEEQASPAAFGYGACDGGDQNNRVRELFRIVIDTKPPTHSPVRVDGHDLADSALPADGSVSYQELPDSATTRWLVPLGSVEWHPDLDSTKQGFKPSAHLDDDRHYAGIVAAEILAPAGKLRIRPRNLPADPDKADFATVEGRLEVEGELHADRKLAVDGDVDAKKDIILWGGKLSFSTPPADDNALLWLRRLPGTSDLRIHIGPSPGTQRLTIGPGSNEDNPSPATEKEVLTVSGDDKVAIDTGVLSFGTQSRQRIDLSTADYGIGVDNRGFYCRTASEFAWYRGGVHPSVPLSTGTPLMRLSAASGLTISGTLHAASLHATSGDVVIDGGSLLLRGALGDTGTDDLAITRVTKAFNQNDLRIIIGDDVDGTDAFTIGPINGGQYKEQFKVTNAGNVTVAGDLTVKQNLTVQQTTTMQGAVTADAGLTVTGNTQLQTLAVSGPSSFAADISLASGAAIKYGTGKFPIDMKTGVASPTTWPHPVHVVTDLPTVTQALLHVSLTSIKKTGTATNLEWTVKVLPLTPSTGPNFTFMVDTMVSSGAVVEQFSWIAFFVA
ncbi:MAG: hypothetical protein QOC81_1078 [Thermoanaerobaculia bacterium]|jgi:hypothetical protein|nr:hypothetical protein [Thermoanaerobaculia bacterium]